MPVTFLQVTQKTLETSWLDCFQLLLHGFHIGSERELAAIIEDQMIGWVDALQIEPFVQRCSQGAKFRFIQQRHDKKSGSRVEMMAIAAEAVTAPAGARVLFQDRDVQSASGKMDCGGDPADARTDDDHRFCFHSFPSGCEISG